MCIGGKDMVRKQITLSSQIVKELVDFNGRHPQRPIILSKVCQEALRKELDKEKGSE